MGDQKREKTRIKVAKWRERLRHKIDVRVCGICRYGFISKKGSNVCSQCLKEMLLDPSLPRVSIQKMRTSHHMRWKNWPLSSGSSKALIPLPNMDLPLVKEEINRVFELLRKSHNDGIWYVDSMPRLRLGPFKELKMRKLGNGRSYADEP